jgi:hypothetical protein
MTGPYGKTIKVLRSPDAVTTYKRNVEPDASMRAISPAQVFEQLKAILVSLKTGVATQVD